jgi:hypothetical protein
MKKLKYEPVQLEIVELNMTDIVTTSVSTVDYNFEWLNDFLGEDI